jgi:hypothetical protein
MVVVVDRLKIGRGGGKKLLFLFFSYHDVRVHAPVERGRVDRAEVGAAAGDEDGEALALGGGRRRRVLVDCSGDGCSM